MPSVGQLIKQKRVAAGLSQDKLGKACGLSDSEIHKIETGKRGKPNWENLCKIARVLQIHPFIFLREAGYISENDIHPSSKVHGLDQLGSRDIENVQLFVDFLISRNGNDKGLKGGL